MWIHAKTVRSGFLLIPYFLMLAVGLLLPSDGQHGILSVKSLSFLLTFFSLATYVAFSQKYKTSQIKLFISVGFSVAFLLTWLLIGMIQDETTSLAQWDQFKLFIITLFVPLASLYLLKENIITPQSLYKAAIYANFTYIFLKVMLVALHLLNLVDIWNLLETVGFRFMRMNIYGGIDRIQTSVDLVTPFLLLFVLHSKSLGVSLSRSFKWSYFVLSLLSTFLSFSRLLLAVYFLSLLLYWLTLGPKGLFKGFVVLVLSSAAAYQAIGPEKVNHMIERRFFSRDNTQSDSTRVQQTNALLDNFEKHSFFGKGIGGYASGYIRDKDLLHSYEVQWVAFLMQFGVLGLLLLFLPLLYTATRFLKPPFSRTRIAFLALFLIWLLSGLTNPFLISLASGIIYTLFFVADTALRSKESPPIPNAFV